MTLERFRRNRMVVLTHQAMAYQAARAMADNHVGSVLVSEPGGIAGIVSDRDLALAVLGGDLDPRATALDEFMSEEVVTCDIGASLDKVVELMRHHAVRRIPITENGRLVGLITFDDLVVDGSVGLDALRSIVSAQLEVEAPHKAAGLLHPEGPANPQQRAAGRARALMRAQARADATQARLVKEVSARAGGLDLERSERALLLGACMLCRRLTSHEAQHLVAQLPSKLHRQLDRCLDGPDRSVTLDAITREFARTLGLDAEQAERVARAVFTAIANATTEGIIATVRGQLPDDMKALFEPIPKEKQVVWW